MNPAGIAARLRWWWWCLRNPAAAANTVHDLSGALAVAEAAVDEQREHAAAALEEARRWRLLAEAWHAIALGHPEIVVAADDDEG